MLLQITSDTWIVTGLGFGIVLLLLCCLVFVLHFFGWTMQRVTVPKEPKAEKAAEEKKTPDVIRSASVASEPEKAAIAMALSMDAGDNDVAAVAYALYLASCDTRHDQPTAMISLRQRETAWNTKSVGLNNIGF